MSTESRYYTSYTGVSLPLKLVGEIEESALQNRNTYFLGIFDDAGRLLQCQKFVYGDIEMDHQYSYNENGVIAKAEIRNEDDELETLLFDAEGRPVR